MKQIWLCAIAVTSLIFGCVATNPSANAQNAKPEIVHDSEYYILFIKKLPEWNNIEMDQEE